MKSLKNLVWIYFWLLLFEGVLRKWLIPSLNAPLLLVRDPVVLLIYIQAFRHGLSFRSGFITSNSLLAFGTVLLACFFGYGNILVTIYGFLADFFQVPLIFLIPQILDRDDVLKMGKYLLWLVTPMAMLTVLQFRSDPGSWWNKGAMATHYGTVRPSGTFSYGNGLCFYFATAAAFLFYGYLQPRTYKLWVLATATLFTLLAGGCSGSRTFIAMIGLVLVVAVLCVVLKGRGAGGILIAAALVGVATMILSSSSAMDQGTEQLAQRFQDAGNVEGGTQGFFARFGSTLFGAITVIPTVPFFGYGLGTGTNGAGALYDYTPISDKFPWVENEWERLVSESGPVLGLSVCLFRLMLTLHLGAAALRAFQRDNILPALLFAAGGLTVLNGQWGGPVPLGFAIFGGGLILAACHEPQEWEDEVEDQEAHADDELEDEQSPAHDRA